MIIERDYTQPIIDIDDRVVYLYALTFHRQSVRIHLRRGSEVFIDACRFIDGPGNGDEQNHLLLLSGLDGDNLREPSPLVKSITITRCHFETTNPATCFDDLVNLIGVLGTVRTVKRKKTSNVIVTDNTFTGPTSRAGCQLIIDRYCRNVWARGNSFSDYTHCAAEIAGGVGNRVWCNTARENPAADAAAFYCGNFYDKDEWGNNYMPTKGKFANKVIR